MIILNNYVNHTNEDKMGILIQKKRVTITIDKSVDANVREIQTQQILKLNKSISFSEIIEQLLKQSLTSQRSSTDRF